ncbi:MAG: acyltransferase [Pseudomonadota bacterium]
MPKATRLYYLDNLKVFLIILVIMHHVGQAYGATGGGWFYSYPGERAKPLEFFFAFNASFFMGLFFFISGYFYPQSFDRHGAGKFLKDKCIRFGIPLVFVCFLVTPLLEYVKYVHYVHEIGFPEFYGRIWQKYGLRIVYPGGFNFAHLWFVEHLLVYAMAYAAIRSVLPTRVAPPAVATAVKARWYVIIAYILLLGMITALMRQSWGFPIDRWISFLGFIQMEPAHFPQYLSLFIFGALACRWSYLDSITTPRDILWLLPGVGVFVVTVIQRYTADHNQAFFLWPYREALLCTGVCIGLLALFKTFFDRTDRIMQKLSENAFGAYILHVPVVVALQYAFDPVQAGAFTLFVIVSALSIPGSFLVATLARRIPGVKRVL